MPPLSDKLLDMTYMVVDKSTGDVLYHLDNDRALIENLYAAGEGTRAISHRLKAGLGGEDLQWLSGYYHGAAGQFAYRDLPIQQWALVLFKPDESLNSYMTNWFLVLAICLTFAVGTIATAIVLLRLCCDTGELKRMLHIPQVIDRRKIMVFTSIFCASCYIGYWLQYSLSANQQNPGYSFYAISLLPMILCLGWGFWEYQRYYHQSSQYRRQPINIWRGGWTLILLFSLYGTLILAHINLVGGASASALKWYYSTLYNARLDREYRQIHETALTRYPNSITRFGQHSLDMFEAGSAWRSMLEKRITASPSLEHNQFKGNVIEPQNVLHFSQLINTTELHSWLQRYLASVPRTGAKNVTIATYTNLVCVVIFMSICWLWLYFNRRILSIRLFGSPHFLRHLNYLLKNTGKIHWFEPNPDLSIELQRAPPQGYAFSLLLKQQHDLPAFFQYLQQHCPFLNELAAKPALEEPLPNMKIQGILQPDGWHIHLWDLDIPLERAQQRCLLLTLINHLKSLVESQHIKALVLYSGFHSLQRLCVKDTMLSEHTLTLQHLDRTEHFAWAECLMDFTVNTPIGLLKELDHTFITSEINAMPALAFLQSSDTPDYPAKDGNIKSCQYLQDWHKNDKQWASINYILLHADAFYRFKWETCSAAEKLALYYLVQHKRINPTNVQMLEHLAMNGLIKVIKGRIQIINQSFAYFVRFAEDKDTLTQLVDKGDVGKWQDYRLPITLAILTVIIGIALTSGNSLYMIVGSVMGILGTVSSLTNSAGIIRSNINK